MLNITQFCKEAGISRVSYYRYTRQGMPAGPDAAKSWIAARQAIDGRGGRKDRGEQTPGSDIIGLKQKLLEANLRKTEAEAALAEFEADIQSRNLVPLDDAKTAIAATLGPLRALLDALTAGNFIHLWRSYKQDRPTQFTPLFSWGRRVSHETPWGATLRRGRGVGNG